MKGWQAVCAVALFYSGGGSLDARACDFSDADVLTIRSQARYVLDTGADESGVALYLYAPDETDRLCDELGGFCAAYNDRVIEGNYCLVAIKDARDQASAMVVGSLPIGRHSFGSGKANSGQLKFLSLQGTEDRLITLSEDANPDGTNFHTEFFRLSAAGQLAAIKFFLTDGSAWTDTGAPEVNGKELVLVNSYVKAPPDKAYLEKLPGTFDWQSLTQRLAFTYRDGNFYAVAAPPQ